MATARPLALLFGILLYNWLPGRSEALEEGVDHIPSHRFQIALGGGGRNQNTSTTKTLRTRSFSFFPLCDFSAKRPWFIILPAGRHRLLPHDGRGIDTGHEGNGGRATDTVVASVGAAAGFSGLTSISGSVIHGAVAREPGQAVASSHAQVSRPKTGKNGEQSGKIPV